MTYNQAKQKAEELKERFDKPFSSSDKQTIETLYFEVLRKRFVPTTCQQCYHDALIEICLTLKKIKTMPKVCNYRMKAGFIISCPDFYGGKIFTNENLTDKVAKEFLDKYPKMEDYFQKIPAEELIENKGTGSTGTTKKDGKKSDKVKDPITNPDEGEGGEGDGADATDPITNPDDDEEE